MPEESKKHRKKRKWDSTLKCREYHHLYSSAQWKKIRFHQLMENPLCIECLKTMRTQVASVVDHIIPHQGNLELFYDSDNLQSLCKRCHDRKTYSESIGKVQ